MLSEDLNALAFHFRRYSEQGGRVFTASEVQALHYALADLAEQAAALEQQVACLGRPPTVRWAADDRLRRFRVIEGGQPLDCRFGGRDTDG
jgi:hypothetical protein